MILNPVPSHDSEQASKLDLILPCLLRPIWFLSHWPSSVIVLVHLSPAPPPPPPPTNNKCFKRCVVQYCEIMYNTVCERLQVVVDPAKGLITLGAAIPLIPPSTNCSNGYIHFVGSMVPENAPANSSSVNSSLACFADMAAGSVSAHAITPGVSVSHFRTAPMNFKNEMHVVVLAFLVQHIPTSASVSYQLLSQHPLYFVLQMDLKAGVHIAVWGTLYQILPSSGRQQ